MFTRVIDWGSCRICLMQEQSNIPWRAWTMVLYCVVLHTAVESGRLWSDLSTELIDPHLLWILGILCLCAFVLLCLCVFVPMTPRPHQSLNDNYYSIYFIGYFRLALIFSPKDRTTLRFQYMSNRFNNTTMTSIGKSSWKLLRERVATHERKPELKSTL